MWTALILNLNFSLNLDFSKSSLFSSNISSILFDAHLPLREFASLSLIKMQSCHRVVISSKCILFGNQKLLEKYFLKNAPWSPPPSLFPNSGYFSHILGTSQLFRIINHLHHFMSELPTMRSTFLSKVSQLLNIEEQAHEVGWGVWQEWSFASFSSFSSRRMFLAHLSTMLSGGPACVVDGQACVSSHFWGSIQHFVLNWLFYFFLQFLLSYYYN